MLCLAFLLTLLLLLVPGRGLLAPGRLQPRRTCQRGPLLGLRAGELDDLVVSVSARAHELTDVLGGSTPLNIEALIDWEVRLDGLSAEIRRIGKRDGGHKTPSIPR